MVCSDGLRKYTHWYMHRHVLNVWHKMRCVHVGVLRLNAISSMHMKSTCFYIIVCLCSDCHNKKTYDWAGINNNNNYNIANGLAVTFYSTAYYYYYGSNMNMNEIDTKIWILNDVRRTIKAWSIWFRWYICINISMYEVYFILPPKQKKNFLFSRFASEWIFFFFFDGSNETSKHMDIRKRSCQRSAFEFENSHAHMIFKQ